MAKMSARVDLSGGFSRRYTGGVCEFAIPARSLRGVIKASGHLVLACAHLEEGSTVAVDGEIREVGYLQPLRHGGEVFFIPKLERG